MPHAVQELDELNSPSGKVRIPRLGLPRGPLKVLHVVNGEHYAGAERVQDLLALRLPEFGVATAFACVKPDRFPAARMSATPLYKLPMRGRFDLRPATKLARLIREEQFDLVHTHTPRAALVARFAAGMAKVPMVHHVHGQTSTEVRRRWLSRISAVVERMSLSKAKAVIAVSKSAGVYIAKHGIEPARVRTIYNGVPASDVLAPRATPQGRWTLGAIALFRPRKGLETLLEALALLRHEGHDVRLRAVGSFETADYERTIKEHARRLSVDNFVEWTGFRSEIDKELAQMDLLVFPSLLAEGLPMVIIEAMASGVPVVGTRVDGVTDAIRHCSDGLLCEPGDAVSLSDAIRQIVSGQTDWQSLREAAWRRQRQQFSDQSMAESLAKLYREILYN
jgi:glycosyltransferase involved in cell wall biosynthesis